MLTYYCLLADNNGCCCEQDDDDHILYLWRNGPSVIIGRFQSAWKECEVIKMEENKVNLVRRASGGGAVYQDLNNSIFTFLTPRDGNDVAANNSIITKALLARSNIIAVPTGRNDIEVDGFKVSGAAFRQTGNRALHHGTLLLDVDMTALERYLTPNKLKMQSKGIASVAARVNNLKKFDASLTHDSICDAISDSFQKHYDTSCEVIEVDESYAKEESSIQAMMDELMDHNWRFGKEPAFTNNVTTRFSWGMMDIYLTTKKGSVISEVTIYSDALDTEFITRLQDVLVGAEYSQVHALRNVNDMSPINCTYYTITMICYMLHMRNRNYTLLVDNVLCLLYTPPLYIPTCT